MAIHMAKVSDELLAILRCPVTKASLVQEGSFLVSTAAAPDGTTPRYSIEEGILLLLRPDQVDDDAPVAPETAPA